MLIVWYVVVGVALSRPPAVHELRKYAVAAESETEARLIACQMAGCTSVMPVSAEVVGAVA